PSSVVQTGVKFLGCENSTAQPSPIHSWKLTVPCVVSAVKSGAISLMRRLMAFSSGDEFSIKPIIAPFSPASRTEWSNFIFRRKWNGPRRPTSRKTIQYSGGALRLARRLLHGRSGQNAGVGEIADHKHFDRLAAPAQVMPSRFDKRKAVVQ